jgi:hypothetical protein
MGLNMSKVKVKMKRPYSERTDIEKLESNWRKIHGLLNREQWSAAVVRAATSVEIAANIVVREELVVRIGAQPDFVDNLLRWANGVQGKFDRLIIPLAHGAMRSAKLRKLKPAVAKINEKRNQIVHSGHFSSETTATGIVRLGRHIITALLTPYNLTPDVKGRA